MDALQRIDDGETVIDPTIVSRLLGRRRREDPLAVLSDQEREVHGWGSPLGNPETAAVLAATNPQR